MLFFPELETTARRLFENRLQIDKERQIRLQDLIAYIVNQKHAAKPVQLLMICTHNSRRSIMAQLMAHLAAEYNKVIDIKTFSGGTEATEFHPHTVCALQRCGMHINIVSDTTLDSQNNPHYQVKLGAEYAPIECFSKKYSDTPNPKNNFAAIMTCSHADENCPLVYGCDERIALPYEDPKSSDGTPQQDEIYYERAIEIGHEFMYVFQKVVANLL